MRKLLDFQFVQDYMYKGWLQKRGGCNSKEVPLQKGYSSTRAMFILENTL